MTRLLIVEDQPEIRMLIQMALEFENFEIHEAADGDAWPCCPRCGPTWCCWTC
jgi:DNA-binding response OmpR family regulator